MQLKMIPPANTKNLSDLTPGDVFTLNLPNSSVKFMLTGCHKDLKTDYTYLYLDFSAMQLYASKKDMRVILHGRMEYNDYD